MHQLRLSWNLPAEVNELAEVNITAEANLPVEVNVHVLAEVNVPTVGPMHNHLLMYR